MRLKHGVGVGSSKKLLHADKAAFLAYAVNSIARHRTLHQHKGAKFSRGIFCASELRCQAAVPPANPLHSRAFLEQGRYSAV